MAGTTALTIWLGSAGSAAAQLVRYAEDGSMQLDSYGVAWFAAFSGSICFAVVSAAALIRARARSEVELARLRKENDELKLVADRSEAALAAEDQRLIVWSGSDEEPLVAGSLPESTRCPTSRSGFLAFGTWLAPSSTAQLEKRIAALRESGESFADTVEAQSGTVLEATGWASGSRFIVRFRNLSRERLEFVALSEAHQELSREVAVVHHLLDALAMPVWLRDAAGKLSWVNKAYSRAVDVASAEAVVGQQAELLDSAARQAVQRQRESEPVFAQRLSVVAAGARRIFDIVDAACGAGSGGIATDVSELEKVQSEIRRTVESHARTLDQLATAVAIFGPDKRLQFYNEAYRSLFGFDAAFLEGAPEDSAVLDQLRALRKIPEQADYRTWKREMLSAYQSLEARETWWHLPGGQTLRMIANPHPSGGVTYVYENVTERLDLESRYNALIRVQGETLDHLNESVVVFGSDGRLRLWNPAFIEMWSLGDADLSQRPHINEIIARLARINRETRAFDEIRNAVTGLSETRERVSGRIERHAGNIVDFTTVPLPDGATLVTFVDVTDSVNVERALVDKNEALEEADKLKNEFIQHVSYELRSPLTNIIGFAQLLADEKMGSLNPKQREYTGYIMNSSGALLTIINDILDLATVDAGIMELEIGDVDASATLEAAAAGLRDRLQEASISLTIEVAPDIGMLRADEKRLRQILFNLLSNAISFSEDGGRITVSCRREGDEVVFAVRDEGRGIPKAFIESVFGRFESKSAGARRRGAGLGLSIVKSFVELHGGKVDIMSVEGAGTTVTCRLPAEPKAISEAAE
ncbi:PAS domain-containing sensor histidine kinase [Hartmannibacter diazotrophicus]|uniref:sensor histidine kinase n=1 Tax=Hartmannibacter diazotrophicus TaxID=1482074 RepID=UPI0018D52C9A|nr:PAS domain-containing sensor histidine kinase [Hartmannibacter diazotrophicus]